MYQFADAEPADFLKFSLILICTLNFFRYGTTRSRNDKSPSHDRYVMFNRYIKVISFHFLEGGGAVKCTLIQSHVIFFHLFDPLVLTEDHCIPEYRETALLHRFCTDILRVNIHNTVCLYCRYRTSTNSSKLTIDFARQIQVENVSVVSHCRNPFTTQKVA